MTRDEHREKCIKTMAIAWLRYRGYKWPDEVQDWLMRLTIEEQTVAFDALSTAAARVVPAEITAAMMNQRPGGTTKLQATKIFAAMSAAGDLTNPPEGLVK